MEIEEEQYAEEAGKEDEEEKMDEQEEEVQKAKINYQEKMDRSWSERT